MAEILLFHHAQGQTTGFGYTIVDLMDLENLAVEGGSTLEVRLPATRSAPSTSAYSHIRGAPDHWDD